MKTILKTLLTAAPQHIAYWLALFCLRCLEQSLIEKRQALTLVTDPATRTAMSKAMQPLFLAVAFATNRVLKLRSSTTSRRSWRTA